MKEEFISFCNWKVQSYLQAWLNPGSKTMSSDTFLYPSDYSTAKNSGHCIWNRNQEILKGGMEKANWLGTVGPKEQHHGEFPSVFVLFGMAFWFDLVSFGLFFGGFFALYIPNIESEKIETHKHWWCRWKMTPPPRKKLPSTEGPGKGRLPRQFRQQRPYSSQRAWKKQQPLPTPLSVRLSKETCLPSSPS